MPKFAFADFHGMGTRFVKEAVGPDGLIEAESFEEAFEKLTGIQSDAGDDSDPYIRYLGNGDEQVFYTLAKVTP